MNPPSLVTVPSVILPLDDDASEIDDALDECEDDDLVLDILRAAKDVASDTCGADDWVTVPRRSDVAPRFEALRGSPFLVLTDARLPGGLPVFELGGVLPLLWNVTWETGMLDDDFAVAAWRRETVPSCSPDLRDEGSRSTPLPPGGEPAEGLSRSADPLRGSWGLRVLGGVDEPHFGLGLGEGLLLRRSSWGIVFPGTEGLPGLRPVGLPDWVRIGGAARSSIIRTSVGIGMWWTMLTAFQSAAGISLYSDGVGGRQHPGHP